MRTRSLGYLAALVVFALDQLAKWLVTGPLGVNRVGDQLVLLPIFQFTYTQNNGISLGLFNATTEVGRWMLVALTSAIAIGVAYWMGREKNRIDQVALGMVLGGALGNILDRVRHGYVVDFADLHFGAWRPFLIFNVGDAAISIAVAILLLRAFVSRKDQSKGSGPEETIEHA
ncbi:signal peptidase II [Sphingomonas sp.]|uniref:signal peptidase II n=1 Tax=Sphingomonas sp. TaxID=28214 RepID=UPI0038AD6690